MLFKMRDEYRKYCLVEGLKGKNYKVSFRYRFLPEKDVNKATEDIQR